MVKLPSLEEYLSASQQNTTILFKDIELKEGILETNALGLPRIRSGNFAIILKVTVKCLHFFVLAVTIAPKGKITIQNI